MSAPVDLTDPRVLRVLTDPEALALLSEDETSQLHAALVELDKDRERQHWQNLFPDVGPLRRELYPKHIEHFRAGAAYRERLLMAANRIGKTVAGGFEVNCHLTGRYPHWWEGRRFDHPIDAWVAGDTNETTRDIIQKQLLGDIDWVSGQRAFDGVGIIPHECHGKGVFKQNTNGLLDHIPIKHTTGRWSNLAFKSYEQGRKVFQGTAKHLIWLDEECPMDVYGECLIRTTTTNGIVLLTFTPLLGMSEVVLSFLQPDKGEMARA
jgi:phage terminase large subunit-like protein